ncbi:MAG: trigger factor [Spirochaetes bacterium]|nr:trigger factor [Spirochaetota bacterium]
MSLDYKFEKEGIKGKINLTITKEYLKTEYEKTLQNYIPKIQIKGFRPGKAPRSLIEAKYGESIKFETFKEIVSKEYEEILKKENINPINEPYIDFDNKELDFNKDIKITYNFELPAEAKICELSEVIINYDNFNVSNEDVMDELKAYQKNYSTLEIKDNQSSKGDYININLQIFDSEGNKIKELTEQTIIIGDNFLKLNIDDELIGLKKGDKKEIIKDYTKINENEIIENDVKNKKVKINISINEVKERKYPEIDDNFAKDYSAFNTIEEWKQEIKNQLTEYAKNFERSHNLRKIYDEIIKKSEFLIPETYINFGIKRAFDSYKKQFNISDEVFEKLIGLSGKEKEGFLYSFRPSTIKDIQIELIQLEYLKKLNPQVTKEDIDKFVEEETIRTKKSKDEIYKEVNKHKENVEFFIKLRKIEDYFINNVTKKEGKKYFIKDINKIIEEKNKEEDEKTKKAYEEWENMNKNKKSDQ